MEKLESLWEKGSYDSKNILNRSDKVIPEKYLAIIESEGATLELLEELKVPVFKYRTQITIHGLFPELKNNYLGGYKNLFQNKNLSIGVKYNAVDYEKKKLIYKILRHNGWTIARTSTDFYAFKMIPVNRDNYKDELEKMKAEVSKVDESLFYGHVECFLGKTMFDVFVFGQVVINAVPQKNVGPLIYNITEKTLAENEKEIQEKEEGEKAEYEQRQLAYQKELAEKRIRLFPEIEKVKSLVEKAGWVYVEKYPVTENLVTLNFTLEENIDQELGVYTYTPNYTYEMFVKEPRQRKFRSKTIYIYKDELKEPDFKGSIARETSKKFITGYIKPEPKKSEETPVPQATKVIINNLRIEDYSEKAIAVFGDTKPIKETLSKLGGRFNFRLVGGPGWVFPKTKKDELIKTLGL
jgi:hypothetical protein